MANGKLFKKIKPAINILVVMNKILPLKINKMLLVLFRNTPFYIGVLIRYILLKNICKECGDNVIIYQGVIFDAPEMMNIGNNVSLNPYCYLAGEITIKDNVSIAHHTAFHSFNHTWDNPNLTIRENPLYTKRIIVNEDVWIGCNCVILSGVNIGKRVVVAAGAIVNKSVESHSIIGGNPAKILKKI